MTETARHPGPLSAAHAPPKRATDERTLLRQARLHRDDDPRRTLRLLDELRSPGLRHADPATSGRASLLRAQVLGELGDYEQAAGAVQAARHDLLASGMTLETYGADLVRADLIATQGDSARAVDVIESVLADLTDAATSWQDRDDVVRLRARAHLQLGIATARLTDHGSALRHFDLAWDRFHALGATTWASLARAERAVSYLGLDMTHRALDDLTEARRTLQEEGRAAASARCAIPMSRALVRLDRMTEAIHLLEDVRPVFELRGLLPSTAALDLAMAEALLHAGLAHDARLEAQAAADIFTTLNDIDGTAQARFVAAIAGITTGDPTSADSDLELTERVGSSPRRRQELALARLAELLSSPERDVPERGRRLAALAHAAATTTGDQVMAAITDLATAFTAPEGLAAQRHLEAARRTIELHDLLGLDVARAVVAARVLRLMGDGPGAVLEIMTALTRSSSPRAHVHGPHRPLAHLLVVAIADRTLLELLLEVGTPDAVTDAWRWAAVTRARSLRDLASTTSQQRREPTVDPALPVHRESELAVLSDALDQLIDPDAAVDLAAIRATHVAVRRDIRQQVPHARLPLTTDGDVALPPVPEGPVLQYQAIGNDLVAFVIREGQVYARRLNGATSEVEMFVAEWHAECSRVQLQPEHGQGSGEHHSLRALAALLLRPLEDLLIDLEGMPLVVMAPAGLQTVPFEALPFTTGDVVDADVPSRRFSDVFALRFAAGMHDLASADLELDLASADLELDLAPAGGASLLALMVPDTTTPRIAEETERLAAIHPDATILSGPDATVDALARLARHHDVVHLACHGLYWPEHPSSSGLRLGDRWVTAGEILRMDLSGCLVVLNACATGRAHDTTTESIGLTWALLAAGARGVVATTWPVDDHVALEFADRFHRHLAEGTSPAEAVALAGDGLSAEFSDHPWAWAAHRYIAAGATLLQER